MLTAKGGVVVLPSARCVNGDIAILDKVVDLHTHPLQFADLLDVNITLKRDSSLTFISKGAKNMGCYLSGLDKNSVDSVCVIGRSDRRTYRREDIVNRGLLPLPIEGEEIRVEYYGKQDEIEVEYVTSGFISLKAGDSPFNGTGDTDTQYRRSERCEVNVKCDKDVDVIKKSVCRLIIGGKYIGTGQLINSTSEDKQPYIITAAHVFGENRNYAVNVLFGFETEQCLNYYHPDADKVDLCYKDELLCYLPSYDVALFTLNRLPKAELDPYWAGWDIRDNIERNDDYKCIHHPFGDVKKVSIATDIVIGDYSSMDTPPEGGRFEQNVHYRVNNWTSGATETGSSGSALWNKDHKIIGLLSGGYAKCSNPKDDYFTSLAKAWDVKDSRYYSLKELLDPENTGALVMTGRNLDSTESSINDILGNEDYAIARHCESVSIMADSITEIRVYGNDGRILYYTKVNGQNTVDVNTSKWTNKLLIFVIRYGNKKESSIKLIAK